MLNMNMLLTIKASTFTKDSDPNMVINMDMLTGIKASNNMFNTKLIRVV